MVHDLRLTTDGRTARAELLSGSARSFARELPSHVERPTADVVTFPADETVAFVAAALDVGLSFEPTAPYFEASSKRAAERARARRETAERHARDSLAAVFPTRRRR